MNCTQNNKLLQITPETMVIGVDIGSEVHFARAFDFRGFEFSKRAFRFENTRDGFNAFDIWVTDLMKKNKKTKALTPIGSVSSTRTARTINLVISAVINFYDYLMLHEDIKISTKLKKKISSLHRGFKDFSLFKKLKNKVGFDVTPHMLRHTSLAETAESWMEG